MGFFFFGGGGGGFQFSSYSNDFKIFILFSNASFNIQHCFCSFNIYLSNKSIHCVMTNKMAQHKHTCIVLVKHIHSNQGKILALFLKFNKCLLIFFSYAV